MSFRRYARSNIIKGGSLYGTNSLSKTVYDAVQSGQIESATHILAEGERLDILAGQNYGDSSMWWVIAAASGVGWCLQVPPGTVLKIPVSLDKIQQLVV